MIEDQVSYALYIITGMECQFKWNTRFYFWEVRGGSEFKEAKQPLVNQNYSGQNFTFQINKCLKIPADSQTQKTPHSLFISDFDPSGKNSSIWFQPNFDYEKKLKIFHSSFVKEMFTDEFFYDKASNLYSQKNFDR